MVASPEPKGEVRMKLIIASTLALGLASNITQPRTALAWGDDGHKVAGLIAQSLLEADVRTRVNALLASDTDSLTAHDIASAATWADKLRDANTNGARQKTRQWHFIDIEIASPDLETRAKTIASDLLGHIAKPQIRSWQTGSPSDWAKESFQIAKSDAYGLLGEPRRVGAIACPRSTSRRPLTTWAEP